MIARQWHSAKHALCKLDMVLHRQSQSGTIYLGGRSMSEPGHEITLVLGWLVGLEAIWDDWKVWLGGARRGGAEGNVAQREKWMEIHS